MRLLVLNPNTTASMTAKIGAGARAAAAPGTEIVARNPAKGPPAIQGPEDGEAAVPGVLEEMARGRAEGMDAAIIACFDDTGLFEAREVAGCPVIGIGEAAFHAACLLGTRFSVVTTLAVSIPVIEENLVRYGLISQCVKVRASGVPVLALEHSPVEAEAQVSAEIGRAFAEDGIASVVLGCGGMTDLTQRMSRAHGRTVIDGVQAAVLLAEAAVRLKRLATG